MNEPGERTTAALAPKPAWPAREEAPLTSDSERAVEHEAPAPGTLSPQTSPAAYRNLLPGAAQTGLLRGLQRSFGNRYVGKVLREGVHEA